MPVQELAMRIEEQNLDAVLVFLHAMGLSYEDVEARFRLAQTLGEDAFFVIVSTTKNPLWVGVLDTETFYDHFKFPNGEVQNRLSPIRTK